MEIERVFSIRCKPLVALTNENDRLDFADMIGRQKYGEGNQA